MSRVGNAMNSLLVITLVLTWAAIQMQPALVERVRTAAKGLRALQAETPGRFDTLDCKSRATCTKMANIVESGTPQSQLEELGDLGSDQVIQLYAALKNGAEADSGGIWFNMVREELRAFKQQGARAGLSGEPSVAEVSAKVEPVVPMLVTNQPIEIRTLVGFVPMIVMALYLYLISLMRVLGDALAKDATAAPRDWLFFHPGGIGMALGWLWILAPPIVWLLAASVLRIGFYDSLAFFLVFTSFGLMIVVGIKFLTLVLRIRSEVAIRSMLANDQNRGTIANLETKSMPPVFAVRRSVEGDCLVLDGERRLWRSGISALIASVLLLSFPLVTIDQDEQGDSIFPAIPVAVAVYLLFTRRTYVAFDIKNQMASVFDGWGWSKGQIEPARVTTTETRRGWQARVVYGGVAIAKSAVHDSRESAAAELVPVSEHLNSYLGNVVSIKAASE